MEAYDAITCARRGDVDFLKAVAPEILLNARDFLDCSLLTVAAVEGHLDCCEVIVERCPQLLYHQESNSKRSILHNVAVYNRDKNVENIMRFLLFTADSKPDLELGGGPKIPNYRLLTMQDRWGRTALHLAILHVNDGLTKLLLEADRDFSLLRMVDDEGKTCLHFAAVMGGDQDTVKLICEADPDKLLLSIPDKDGNTPLHKAVAVSNLEIVKLLIERDIATVYCAVNNSNQTPLSMAMDKAAQAGPGSEVICKLLLEKDPSQCTKQTGDQGWTLLHRAVFYGLESIAGEIIQLCPDCIKVEDIDGRTPYMIATGRILSNECRESSISDYSRLIRMLLEKDPKQCTEPKDEHEQPFIHAAVERGLTVVVKTILESKKIDATIINMQDKNGNTPLHIAASIAARGPYEQMKEMTLWLLYDARVSKRVRNKNNEYAIDLINFPYDEAKAMVYSLSPQSDLRDQSNFDLLVAVLIATVSFTAGITVPGGYVSDGANKGSAILLKATAFKVFVVSNNFALLLSLFSVFLKFSSRRLLKEENIYYDPEMGTFRTRLLLKKKDMINQLNVATLCTLTAVYAMVVAFITGSYAVLAHSDGLAITVCVSSCFFLILVTRVMWTMAKQYWHSSKKSG